MDEQEDVLKSIAKARTGLYDLKKRRVVIEGDDRHLLELYKATVGNLGTVFDMEYRLDKSRGPDMRSEITKARGRYQWSMHTEHAYRFCKLIEPYLAEHDTYRHGFCLQLIQICECV